jgi:hypothetical protein
MQLLPFSSNAEAERQAVVLQRHSIGYDQTGMLPAVRSSDWFAKTNLCNQELMNSKQRTYGGEITPDVPRRGTNQLGCMPCAANSSPQPKTPTLNSV